MSAIVIVGAGVAGASLAAALSGSATVTILEAERMPGYHATGRSAAFWSESYGGPLIRPPARASAGALGPFLPPPRGTPPSTPRWGRDGRLWRRWRPLFPTSSSGRSAGPSWRRRSRDCAPAG